MATANDMIRALRHFRSLGLAKSADARPASTSLPGIEAWDYLSSSLAKDALGDAGRLQEILAAVEPATMVHVSGVVFAIEQAIELVHRDVPGTFVECGVWKGGCSLAMLLAQRVAFGRVVRPVHMLDSFQGLPPVGERDGPLAHNWQAGAQPEKFLENCEASETDLRDLLESHDFTAEDYRIIPGWFEDTLAGVTGELTKSGIALLRLDCDWYDPMRVCLDTLVPLVAEEGCVILDDYYAWDGCARSVHDYLSQNDLSYRLKSLFGNYGAYFVKRDHRRSFEEF